MLGRKDRMQGSVVGEVFSGVGKGSHFVSLGGYNQQFVDILGKKPFLGTLNLSVDTREAKDFLSGVEQTRLSGFEINGRRYGSLAVTRIFVDGLAGLIVIPEKTHYEANTLELVSAYNLREALCLKDGDTVAVAHREFS